MPRYQVTSRLGQGGMAEVFIAQVVGEAGFLRPVALKRMAPALGNDPDYVRQFISEARVAAMLSHPNLVTVLDFERDSQGVLFLAMELVDGADLRQITRSLAQRGLGWSPGLVAWILVEILRGLGHAHDFVHDGKRWALVHRDVSPHNVLVSRSGAVKLSDFGVAKVSGATSETRTGVIKGKLAYLSPEQIRGETLDGRSDLFAVGVLAYELFAGRRPFVGTTEVETMAQVLAGRHTPLATVAPHVPPTLARVVEWLLSTAVDARPAKAAQAVQALTAWDGFPRSGADDLVAFLQPLWNDVTAEQQKERDASGTGEWSAPWWSGRVGRWRTAAAGLALAALLAVAAVVAGVGRQGDAGNGDSAAPATQAAGERLLAPAAGESPMSVRADANARAGESPVPVRADANARAGESPVPVRAGANARAGESSVPVRAGANARAAAAVASASPASMESSASAPLGPAASASPVPVDPSANAPPVRADALNHATPAPVPAQRRRDKTRRPPDWVEIKPGKRPDEEVPIP